jgi:lipoprotein NlpD
MRFSPFLSFSFRAAFGVAMAMALAACSSTPSKPDARTRAPSASKSAAVRPATPRQTGATIKLVRPAQGTTLTAFNGSTSKGIDIGGQPGDPVVAAADGSVIYVGKDVRAYGNMIIIKHNDVILTAYAHNRTMLVKENDVVRQGQKIAEMGSTGTTGTKLHFEVRRNGVAVNPQPFLDSASAR